MADFRAHASVPAAHPSLPGHFPGNPIVPGVLLLEHVVDAARAWRGTSSHLQAFPAVKFLSPLRPEERFEIHLEEEGARVRFTCTVGARLLAQGSLTLTADPA